MIESPNSGADGHPFWYARVIGIFHANVLSSHTDIVDKNWCRMDFLWVRWFGMEPGRYRYGIHHARLPKIGFVVSSDKFAFSFLDPAQAIRGVHVIPAFSEGRTSTLLPATKSIARVLNPEEEDDWVNFYINM